MVLLILPLLTTSEHPVRPHTLDQGLDLFSEVSVSELVITGRPVGFIDSLFLFCIINIFLLHELAEVF